MRLADKIYTAKLLSSPKPEAEEGHGKDSFVGHVIDFSAGTEASELKEVER